MKILIVDDDFVSRRLLQTVLNHSGVSDIHSVVSGSEAFEAYSISLEKGEPYDLIFMDMIMPNETGHQALVRIRKLEKEKNTSEKMVKVIIVSSVADPKTIMKTFGDSCDHYVIKPISQEKILNALEKVGAVLS